MPGICPPPGGAATLPRPRGVGFLPGALHLSAMRRTTPLFILLGLFLACAPGGDRRGDTVMFASGADLQSINPLFTVHPLARQVQRYVLLTTLVRYDSAMQVTPYLARRWEWTADGRRATLRLYPGLRWHDSQPTTARDAEWTLSVASDPSVGYPRLSEVERFRARATDDTTLVLDFAEAPGRLPDVLTDLAILPRHLLDTVPRARLRQAAWHQAPVGNGPFRFVAHEPDRRWVFARNPDFPTELGGPPRLARLVIAVVDEPMTKLSALTAGELDFAGIQPAHAAFVADQPALRTVDYPLLFSVGVIFNARRPPFADHSARARVAAALDRVALVQGVVYGFGTPATGPVPPGVQGAGEGRVPVVPAAAQDGSQTGFRFELLTVGSGEAALEQMLQAELARQGITVTIRQLELSAYLDRLYGPAHDFDAAVLGVPGDLELGHLTPLATLAGLPAPAPRSARTRVAELLRWFEDSMPMTFIYHARGLQGINRRVLGVELGLRGELATVSQWHIAP